MKSYLITIVIAIAFSILLSSSIFDGVKQERVRIDRECQKQLLNFDLQKQSIENKIAQIKAIDEKKVKPTRSKSYCLYDQTVEMQKYFEKTSVIPSFLIGYSKASSLFKNQLNRPIELTKSPDYLSSIDSFARFLTVGGIPIDARFYGVVPNENYKFVNKKCPAPRLAYLAPELRKHLLFFSLNTDRLFQGILEVKQEKITKKLIISTEFPQTNNLFEYENSIIWTGGDTTSGETIVDTLRLNSEVINPYRFNICNKAISTLSNICTLDHELDIEMRDYFYDLALDQLIVNIYCKKTNNNEWTKIATAKMTRMK